MEPGSVAKRLKKENQKTVSILEAKTFVEAEALDQLGFVLVGMDEAKEAFVFRESEARK